MSDMRTKRASQEWGYTQKTVEGWCRAGLIPGATQDKPGSPWRIPIDAKCPRPVKPRM